MKVSTCQYAQSSQPTRKKSLKEQLNAFSLSQLPNVVPVTLNPVDYSSDEIVEYTTACLYRLYQHIQRQREIDSFDKAQYIKSIQALMRQQTSREGKQYAMMAGDILRKS